MNLYGNYFAVNGVDPHGEVTITATVVIGGTVITGYTFLKIAAAAAGLYVTC